MPGSARRPADAGISRPKGRPQTLYLVIRSLIKNRVNVTGKPPGWTNPLDALSLYYGDRIALN